MYKQLNILQIITDNYFNTQIVNLKNVNIHQIELLFLFLDFEIKK